MPTCSPVHPPKRTVGLLWRFCFLTLAIAAAVAATASAADPAPEEPSLPALRQANEKAVAQADADNRTKFKDNKDVLLLPGGLVANRKDKTVTFLGEATALAADKPIEFFLIYTDSGKDYEALLVSFAKPSDVHKALEFIGMTPGKPIDYPSHRYWPKGERVFVNVSWTPPPPPDLPPPAGPPPAARASTTQPLPQQVRVEHLVLDARNNKPLAEDGLMFVGSVWTTMLNDPKKLVYAADLSEARAIATDFNEPTTVLDVPRQARKGEVYSFQVPNPQYRFGLCQLVTLTIEPEHKDGKKRVCDLALSIAPKAGGDKTALKDVEFNLFELELPPTKQSAPLNTDGKTLAHVLGALGKVIEDHRDPYVRLDFDGSLTLATVQKISALLAAAEGQGVLRIEPPSSGQPYFRAFLPPEKWRDRRARFGQPWELRLTYTDGKPAAKLLEIRENWDVANPPLLEEKETPAATAQEMAKSLNDQDKDRPRPLCVFVEPDLTYGQLTSFLGPSLETHNQVYVFLPPAEKK
jgi:hypothetical protein